MLSSRGFYRVSAKFKQFSSSSELGQRFFEIEYKDFCFSNFGKKKTSSSDISSTGVALVARSAPSSKKTVCRGDS